MKTEEIAKEIINLLEKSGHIEDLAPVVSLLSEEVHKRREEIIVWLAEKVSNPLGQKVNEALKERFGKQVKVEYRYDQRLIGGLIVEAEGKIYDLSLRGRLQNLLGNEGI